MNKNKNFCKAVNNGKNYYKNKEVNKLNFIDIENLASNQYTHIKKEKINILNEDNLITKSDPYNASLVKVEINEESVSKQLALVPSLLEKRLSSVSSSGSDKTLSPANSPNACTLSLSHQASDGSSSDNSSKPIYIPGRAHTELTTVTASPTSSSQTLQHYVLINSAPYQMIVPSHGITPTSQQGIIQGSVGKSVQLQLMSNPSNLRQNLKSFKSKPNSNVADSLKSSQQGDKNISLTNDLPSKLPYNQLPLDIKKIYFPSHIRAIPEIKDSLIMQNTSAVAKSSLSKDRQKGSLSSNVRSKVTVASKLSNDSENEEEERLHMICQDEGNDNEFSQGQLENIEHDLLEMNNSSISQENLSQGSDSECSIPNLLNDSGKYGFKVYLDDKKDTLKTPTWLMSNITKKLYTNMNKPVPFRVILKKLQNLKKKFNLRAMAVFKYPMFLRHNVVRCPHHLNPLDHSNADFTDNLNHVIRADHPRAIYESSQSGRLSVVVPLDFPENRKEAVPVLLKFMCHNSCVGGISRRPLAVLLTLELNGEELGRSIIDVRVCACPSRDVRSEEKQVISRGLYKKTISHTFVGRRARKRQRPDDIPNLYDEQDEIMYIPVRGLNLYNYLIEMKSLYLKHHADYANKYPDPPLDYRSMDDSSSNFIGIIDSHPRETNSINDEGAIISHSQSFSSVLSDDADDPLYLASRNGGGNQHYVMQSDLQVALLSDDSGDQSDSNIQISSSEAQSNVTTSEQQSQSVYQVDTIQPNGYHYNIKLSTKRHSSSSKKCKNVSAVPDTMHNSNGSSSSKDLSKKSSTKKVCRNNFNGNHIQAYPMTSKSKKGIRKSISYDSGVHSDEHSNKERGQSYEKINESEKVMLAAQVLASHLGSQSIEVHK